MTDEQWQQLAPLAEAEEVARKAFWAAHLEEIKVTGPREKIEAELTLRRSHVYLRQMAREFEEAKCRIFITDRECG